MVLAALAAIATVWVLLLVWVWATTWFALDGDEVSTLRPDVLSLGATGARAPEDATTVLVALTAPMDETRPRPPELAGPILLVQVGAGRDLPAVLVVPSSLVVTVDGSGELALDEVQAQGGIDLVVRALMDYSEVRIDHAIALSVDLLPGLVRALGPLEVCGVLGCTTPTPDEVRAWQVDPDPTEAVRRATDVVRAVSGALTLQDTALSPIATRRAVRLIDAQAVTDVPLRVAPLLRLSAALTEPVRLDIEVLPVVADPSTGRSIVLAEAAMLRFQRLQQGQGFEGIDPVLDMAELKREVDVAVLNGAGIDGLAAVVAEDLAAEGFAIAGTGNAPGFEEVRTVIRYRAGDDRAEQVALLLAEALEGALVEPGERTPTLEGEVVGIEVTLGTDLADRSGEDG
ncbi:MAG: LytR cell envelope-related transcriptional attenuator [Actinomycetota bacterium]